MNLHVHQPRSSLTREACSRAPPPGRGAEPSARLGMQMAAARRALESARRRPTLRRQGCERSGRSLRGPGPACWHVSPPPVARERGRRLLPASPLLGPARPEVLRPRAARLIQGPGPGPRGPCDSVAGAGPRGPPGPGAPPDSRRFQPSEIAHLPRRGARRASSARRRGLSGVRPGPVRKCREREKEKGPVRPLEGSTPPGDVEQQGRLPAERLERERRERERLEGERG